MKRSVLIALTVFLLASACPAGEIFVAPSGDDANPGTREKPLASVQRAKQLIRDARRERGDASAWTVSIAAGTYDLTEPLVFTPGDSGTADAPVRFVGEPGKTVLSGGKRITGWTEIKDGDWKGVWVADVPKTDGVYDYFEQIFAGDRRAARSRYPNEGFLSPAMIEQDSPIKRDAPPVQNTGQRLIAKEGVLSPVFKGVPEEELKYAQLIVHHHWDTTRRIPLRFEVKTGTLIETDPATKKKTETENAVLEIIHTQGAPMKFWNPWRETSPYYLENLRTAFDAPGEWFYDGCAGKVYYRPLPGENPNEIAIVYPRPSLNRLVEFRGQPNGAVIMYVAHISFENIAFRYADSPRERAVMQRAGLPESITGPLDKPGPSQFEPHQAAFFTAAAIDGYGAESLVFNNCEVAHIGEYAVRLQNSNRCRIERCAFLDLGAGALRLGHGSSENVLDNCIIRRAGRFHACAVGVWIGDNCCDNRISHNDIGDMYYTGISVGWQWGYKGNSLRNIIEYNDVHDLGQYAMADMGGIYTLGTSHGTVVRNNIFRNIYSYAYGGWGMYTDEGSEGVLFENNLVYDTKDGSFHQHYGKDNIVRNNILCFSEEHQVAATRVEDHLSFTFERNIVYYDRGKLFGIRAEQVNIAWKSNLWWNTTGNVDFAGKTHEQWVAAAKDIGGLVADPLFVDAAKRDFRLKPESPAGKIGFVPFDFSKAGVYGDENWINRAKGE